MKLPTLFLPHGAGPCFFMDWNPPNTWDRHRHFLQGVSKLLPETPRALLVISAHWEAPEFTVQRQSAPGLVFDYHGFPPHTYKIDWPAPGSIELADMVASLLQQKALPCLFDTQRGFDHGVFVPLKLAFPQADIPCVQLSLRGDLDTAAHVQVGMALAPLREEGVLIIGSGYTYHNLQVLLRNRNGPQDKLHGVEFDHWLSDVVTQSDPEQRNRRLQEWARAPGAQEAVPRPEHLLPLMVVAGAGGSDQGKKIFEDHVLTAVQSAYRFG